MRKLIVTIALVIASSTFANNTTPKNKEWNDNGASVTAQTYHKGDEVIIKKGNQYVSYGVITAICNYNSVKVNGYFVKINDIEVITKYNTASKVK